ncbi:MAG TPA: DNA mismatch repair endonuclease MutL, partial [bacterium]|nr:DNA mismatch repair endonuclease MutL [bacterium]
MIQILPQHLQHKIAAGEVVERPASVIKELVENALDAHATRVSVEIIGGGIDRIVVRDDGIGMDRADAELAFQRYATSKLATEEDLFRIATFGFRGEALASIAAVSEVTLETRQAESLTGTRVVMSGGVRQASEACGCSAGTRITVSKLFFNTPARRKYLKAVQTEHRHCLEAVIDQAIIRPEIGFNFASNERVFFDCPAGQEHAERLADVLGSEWADGILGVEHEAWPYAVRGFIGRPEKAR